MKSKTDTRQLEFGFTDSVEEERIMPPKRKRRRRNEDRQLLMFTPYDQAHLPIC